MTEDWPTETEDEAQALDSGGVDSLRRARIAVVAATLLIVACGIAGLWYGRRDTGFIATRDFLQELVDEKATRLGPKARERIVNGLLRAQAEQGIDALLLAAVIEVESRYRPRATGRRGAVGLMQVRTRTGRSMARALGIPWEGTATLRDPEANIRLGAAYLAEMKERYSEWALALAAYNLGPTRMSGILERGESPPAAYGSRVLETYASLRDACRRHRRDSRSV